ncbi:YggS family pyridoxal phosphate-dependent enzyme, partial [Candidatus Pelagibacter sp.]|nr:YggS family pyridoxal phosphate-dependent enzyme [Candidatus Pelagibacter sp.]
VNIIAVSKTFPISNILPLINANHIHFGENKVQEALEKWTEIKKDLPNIKLHLIGNLQTNKVKFALPLFDYIHSLDSLKLAKKISEEQIKKNFRPKIFIQINIGNEDQKNGINKDDLELFYKKCTEEFNLNIIGLMCLPPFDKNSQPFFLEMKRISQTLNLNELSMGMSNDYMEAVSSGATYVRIGSKIFGERG